MAQERECLSDERLADLFEQKLDQTAIRSIAEHIDRCAPCRRVVAQAARGVEGPEEGDEGGDAALDAPTLRPGSKVGRYVVIECIGAGSMGIVYTARDPDLGRRVALKLLRTGTAGQAARPARLLREAQAMAKLSHANVITIYDVGAYEGRVFLAMELVDGGTLTEWLASGNRSWREVAKRMTLAGEGLAAAHAAGLVHRDFKLDNVLVGVDGRVRVTDFGLARAVGEGTPEGPTEGLQDQLLASMTRTGALVGTPAYMAPEQLAGGEVDARSDIFSFCVAFYEALYAQRPFAGSTLAELREAIAQGAVRPPPRSSRVPAWLRRIVVGGLANDPSARPESMRALLRAIEGGRGRARARLAVGSVAALAAACVVALVVRQTSSRAAVARATHGPAGPIVLTQVPLPASTSAEALRAYTSGLERLRDGDGLDQVAKDFARASELDPALAAADLRYALTQFWKYPAEARAHLARAVEHRYALSERDGLLLDAAQAWIQTQPADADAYARTTEEALTRHPLDAELAYFAANARTETGEFAAVVTFADRAITLDPGFGGAYYFKGEGQSYAGDPEGALATVEACVARVPRESLCLGELGKIDQQEGHCERLERTSQQLMASHPADDVPYWWMANADYSLGRPLETVRELLRQEIARQPPEAKRRFELKDAWAVDVLSGDFESALGRAQSLEEEMADAPAQRFHGLAALWSTSASVESGRPADAAKRAAEYLRRRDAWVAEPRQDDYALAWDPTPLMLLAERQGGALSPEDFEKQRQAWVDAWAGKTRPGYRPFVWLHGYAAVAETAQDAARALAEQPKYGAPPRFMPWTPGDAYVGTTYFLAGRVAEALPYLRRAAGACRALKHPIEQTRAELVLGQALAASGDRTGACAALAVVLARWGHAKPRSVTAEQALAFARTLQCPTQP